MRILGIETSCDETAAAVVEDGTKILSNVVASSAEMHVKTGGIIPEQAARQQVKSIIPVIEEALKKSSTGSTSRSGRIGIDTIAVTVGPGLIGSLLVGVETAKTLAYFYKKPIIPVNHLAAHIYANWLEDSEHKIPQFPALALVVSGGHTDLVLMRDHPSTGASTERIRQAHRPEFIEGLSRTSSGQANIKWISGTRDDAAGEAFDKTARLLGLPYPGGPAISKEAEKYLATHNQPLNLFPRPMIGEKNYDWSFSGLKTSVLRRVKEWQSRRVKEKLDIPKLAAEIQEAIVDVLVEKTLRAVREFKPKSLLLAGGVAANKRLREKFKFGIGHLSFDIDFHVPPPKLCTDNATYIASCARFNYRPVDWKKIKANPGLTIVEET
jgi:N6-L-threonylcarbamoyladenine synthase